MATKRTTFVRVAATLVVAAAAAVASSTESSAAGPAPDLREQPLPSVTSTNADDANGLPSTASAGASRTTSRPPAAGAPYLTSHRGALLNDPAGAAWNFAEMRAAGFTWVALNIGDHEPRRWSDVRERALATGLAVVPWARLGHPHLGETREHCLRNLRRLLETARAWGTTRPIVNVETEIKPGHLGGVITPTEVAHELERAGMDEAAISTEGWLYDVSWLPLSRYAVLLQILPRDNRWTPGEVRGQQRACEKRARDYGFDHVGTSVQTYPMADGTDPQPEWFDLRGANRSVIWGDNVAASGTGSWQHWVG